MAKNSDSAETTTRQTRLVSLMAAQLYAADDCADPHEAVDRALEIIAEAMVQVPTLDARVRALREANGES